MNHLGDRVKRIRERRGITLEQLAAETRVPISSLRVLECGRYNPSLRVFKLLVRALSLADNEIHLLLDAVVDERGALPYQARTSTHAAAQPNAA